ncbi:hypothetical protein [Bradyrhizobium genosp. P]|uniref:hypothetical protein n=1 Tax=Bradyrhizobium genosp. P TaxID=83641 RepID=UPI003CECD24B
MRTLSEKSQGYRAEIVTAIAVIVGAVIFTIPKQISAQEGKNGSSTQHTLEDVTVESQTWVMGEHAVVDLVVVNNGSLAARDLRASCAFFSAAEKEVASSFRQLSGMIGPGRREFRNVDFGPANSEAATISCSISSFEQVGRGETNSVSETRQSGSSNATQRAPSRQEKEIADIIYHELRREHFSQLLDMQIHFKTPDPPDALHNDRPADAVTLNWRATGRSIDLTIRNDNEYEVKNVVVGCILPNGGPDKMRTIVEPLGPHQERQLSGVDFGVNSDRQFYCLVLTAAKG